MTLRSTVRAWIDRNEMRKVVKELDGIEKKLRRKIISKALRTAMKDVVLRDAKRNSPVDEHGRIPRGLRVRTAKGPRGKRLRRDEVGMAVAIDRARFPEAFYASFVFLGTKHITGTKTLREALYVNNRRINVIVRRGIKASIEEIAAEARRQTRIKGIEDFIETGRGSI